MVDRSVDLKRMSDEDLVRLYIATQANQYFGLLYERYSDKVYRKCLMFTKDPAKAEDFTHDIFLKLIVRLGSFREQARFSTWLYTITYNYCTDQLRSQKRQAEVPLEDNRSFPDDSDAELAEMQAQKLKRALEGLSVDEKALLLMKYQDGMSIREMAQLRDINESALKMRLARAKEKLRRKYLETLLFWLVLMAKLLTMLKWPLR